LLGLAWAGANLHLHLYSVHHSGTFCGTFHAPPAANPASIRGAKRAVKATAEKETELRTDAIFVKRSIDLHLLMHPYRVTVIHIHMIHPSPCFWISVTGIANSIQDRYPRRPGVGVVFDFDAGRAEK
jgi:hypothetical protein